MTAYSRGGNGSSDVLFEQHRVDDSLRYTWWNNEINYNDRQNNNDNKS